MVLKCVDQFVSDYMPCGLIGFHNWHDHTVFQTFGNAACADTYFTVNRRGLLKIGVIWRTG